MPIKFRCDYCRQLMGIAHSKAGSLVDCPTCGRTLRVPNTDGTVDPPPSPRVDHNDDGLRRALDELALIGLGDDEPGVPPAVLPTLSTLIPKSSGAPVDEPRVETSAAPAAGPTAVTVDAPLVKPTIQLVNSIALEPLPQQVVVDPPLPPRSRAGGPASVIQSVSLAGASPEEILAGLANQPAPPQPVAVAAPAQVTIRGYSLSLVMLIGVLSFAAGIAGGWGLGRNFVVQRIAESPVRGAAVAPADVPIAKPVVKGRVTYRNAQGQLEPDTGACVLLLPVKHTGGVKLASLGLRPNDDSEARQQALKTLEGHGGRLAIADEDGSFRVEIPDAGDYRLIALSHFHGRPRDAARDEDASKTLTDWFERPEQLVGQLAYQVAEIKHKGSGTVIWDHTF